VTAVTSGIFLRIPVVARQPDRRARFAAVGNDGGSAMTTEFTRRMRRPRGALALAVLLATLLAGCAQNALDTAPGSGSSAPGQIDYHSGPYRMQNG
jgi:predicted small secreted protein